jgi:dipeptidyl aminopeptidase/acylaminoacyl peptidase
MVVLPHGGPEDRDTYDFDIFVQALAAKGWLVLQPNFRGSGGFGRAFAQAGYRHWGDRMQQDVEDAVAQVVAAGRADPRHIAVFGASYGGYAALMGAILRPDLYRCAVSFAGPSDLIEILKSEREDGEDSPSYQYWRTVLGDPKTDAAALKQASPRQRAAEMRVPVLLMHGTADAVVPVEQSRIMAAALKAAGKYHELKELPGETHSGWSRETWKLVLEKTTSFIAASFGTGA